jgi:hypothetical protein
VTRWGDSYPHLDLKFIFTTRQQFIFLEERETYLYHQKFCKKDRSNGSPDLSTKADTDQINESDYENSSSPSSQSKDSFATPAVRTASKTPSSSPSASKATIDPKYSLKGNTLRVYMHILRTKGNDPIGIREIQRELNLSSATLAKYHLEKLREMFLLSQNENGSYSLLKQVKVDVLQPFITLGSIIIPRLFTYAVTISILFAYLVMFVLPSQNLAEIAFFSVTIGAVSLLSLWYETVRSWRNAPH